ncbi:preprotein translocase subunit SecG [Alterileibacterium massiliense]|uniref:preprotein translocase subunit SecG n=1 Tax=Alterileibacterium massiliense TaxID=1870997 RepID=UPI0008DA8782|nr:preprotein translocase subunit SecG [Alterileibacterium massiliense]
MHTFLMVLLLVDSIILILSVLLQSSKSDGLSGSIAGGAEQLFGKKKSTGYDGILARITIITSILFFLVSLVTLAFFS